MFADQVMSVSLEQFQARTRGKKIVLLYPWSSYRNVFLSHFMQTANSNLLYHCLDGTDSPLEAWLVQLADELDRVQAGFSDNLRQAIPTGDPRQMGEALAVDLATYPQGQPLILFIDEFDRAISNDSLRGFVHSLVAGLSSGTQVVFNARCFSLELWYDALISGDLGVLGTEQRENEVMFTVETRQRPQLEVYAFGRGHVFVNGHEIVQWDGALPRNLFFYLVDHPLTTRDELFEVFWPNLAIKEATNVFHVTKRKIGERISMPVEAGGDYELTQYKSGFYIPSEKVRRHYDVTEFLSALEQALVAVNDEAEKSLLMRAIALYRGPFLSTVAMDWRIERGEQLQQSYVQALVSMARWHKRNHDWQSALGYFVRVLKEIPEREDIHREVMSIYLQQERYADAACQYRMLETIVNETLQIAPDPETQALYGQIQMRI